MGSTPPPRTPSSPVPRRGRSPTSAPGCAGCARCCRAVPRGRSPAAAAGGPARRRTSPAWTPSPCTAPAERARCHSPVSLPQVGRGAERSSCDRGAWAGRERSRGALPVWGGEEAGKGPSTPAWRGQRGAPPRDVSAAWGAQGAHQVSGELLFGGVWVAPRRLGEEELQLHVLQPLQQLRDLQRDVLHLGGGAGGSALPP